VIQTIASESYRKKPDKLMMGEAEFRVILDDPVPYSEVVN
jgi:hypothetical protein